MHRYVFAHSPFVDDAKCIKGAPLALERLQVSVAFEVDALHEVLEELRLSLSVSLPCSPKYLVVASNLHQSSAAHLRTRAIVVDTVTPLFGPLLSPVSSQGHAIMTSSMRQLRAFAEFFSLTVFVRRSLIRLCGRTNPLGR
jgi:RAD51-like protein 3